MDNRKYIEITDYRSHHSVLVKSLDRDELLMKSSKGKSITQKVTIHLDQLINNDSNWLKEHCSNLITGSGNGLTNIVFTIAGRTSKNYVILKVTAELNHRALK